MLLKSLIHLADKLGILHKIAQEAASVTTEPDDDFAGLVDPKSRNNIDRWASQNRYDRILKSISIAKGYSNLVNRYAISKIPVEYLERLVGDEKTEVRAVVAFALPSDKLHLMIKDTAPYIRAMIAERLPKEVLPQMINDEDDYVRFKVADRVDPKFIEPLLNDSGEYVRISAILNVSKAGYPSKIIARLLRSPDDNVRLTVVDHLPKDNIGLYIALFDALTNIRQVALSRISWDLIVKFQRKISGYLIRDRLNNEPIGDEDSAQPHHLEALKQNEDSEVRELVAEKAMPESLLNMIDDESASVIIILAKRLPPEYLPLLLEHNREKFNINQFFNETIEFDSRDVHSEGGDIVYYAISRMNPDDIVKYKNVKIPKLAAVFADKLPLAEAQNRYLTFDGSAYDNRASAAINVANRMTQKDWEEWIDNNDLWRLNNKACLIAVTKVSQDYLLNFIDDRVLSDLAIIEELTERLEPKYLPLLLHNKNILEMVNAHAADVLRIYDRLDTSAKEYSDEFITTHFKNNKTLIADLIKKRDAKRDLEQHRASLSSVKYYGAQTRFLDRLRSFVPISIKNLKSKYPSLAAGVSGLIAFSKGKNITSEMIDAYSKWIEARKFDEEFAALRAIVPITHRELKEKYPEIAKAVSEIISFSKGKDPLTIKFMKGDKEIEKKEDQITNKIIDDYINMVRAREYAIDYTTWDRPLQRSVEHAPKPQLVLNILASPELIGKLKSDGVYELFDKINSQSKESTHPYIKDQLGWARLELNKTEKYILVDEIQTDQENACFQIKTGKRYVEDFSESLGVTKEELVQMAGRLAQHMKDFEDVAMKAITQYARNNGYTMLYYHTLLGGKSLKGNEPPEYLYTGFPLEHFFTPSKAKPFGLSAKFFERQAARKMRLAKLASMFILTSDFE